MDNLSVIFWTLPREGVAQPRGKCESRASGEPGAESIKKHLTEDAEGARCPVTGERETNRKEAGAYHIMPRVAVVTDVVL